jgi:hypothetical protein
MMIAHTICALLLLLMNERIGVDGAEMTNITSKLGSSEIRPEFEAENASNQRTHSVTPGL